MSDASVSGVELVEWARRLLDGLAPSAVREQSAEWRTSHADWLVAEDHFMAEQARGHDGASRTD